MLFSVVKWCPPDSRQETQRPASASAHWPLYLKQPIKVNKSLLTDKRSSALLAHWGNPPCKRLTLKHIRKLLLVDDNPSLMQFSLWGYLKCFYFFLMKPDSIDSATWALLRTRWPRCQAHLKKCSQHLLRRRRGGGIGWFEETIGLQDTSVLLREQADHCVFFTVDWRESLLKHERWAGCVTAPNRSHVKDPCGRSRRCVQCSGLLLSSLPRSCGETV